jgi:hypothetical protein
MSWPALRLSRRVAVGLAVVCVAVLVAEAWFPFRLELPVWRPSAPDRTAEGVAFGGNGEILASEEGMGWVAEAAGSGRLQVQLEARTGDADQLGPARLLAVSQDHFQADLMVGQEGDDLVVRVRRPGSDPSGEPPFRVAEVFADDRWRALAVTVSDGRVIVAVDGVTQVDESTGPHPLTGWDQSYRVSLGDDIGGERAWQGRLRRAEVDSGDGPTVDLLADGMLETPGGWELRGRVAGLRSAWSDDPLLLSLLRVLVFVPVGAALRRLLRRPLSAAVAVTSVALVLNVGKAFIAGRHPSLVDLALSALGGWAGVLLVDALLRRHHRPGGPGTAGHGGRGPGGDDTPGPDDGDHVGGVPTAPRPRASSTQPDLAGTSSRASGGTLAEHRLVSERTARPGAFRWLRHTGG